MKSRVDRVAVIGATADIGRAITRRFAGEGVELVLTGRDGERLSRDAHDIELRFGVTPETVILDICDGVSVDAFVDGLEPLPDVVVCVVGMLADQRAAQADPDLAALVTTVNFTGPARLLERFAARFEDRGSGTLVGISSVAGERGRASNYIYGSAKAGFTTFLSGLRNRLAEHGVRVVTVLPGFVDTRMTTGMDLPPALTVQPGAVADAVWDAVVKGRDTVYIKWVWRPIMWLIRALPEWWFKRTRL